jgi:hypothetical protein
VTVGRHQEESGQPLDRTLGDDSNREGMGNDFRTVDLVSFRSTDSDLDILCRIVCEVHEGKIIAMGEHDQKTRSVPKETLNHIE